MLRETGVQPRLPGDRADKEIGPTMRVFAPRACQPSARRVYQPAALPERARDQARALRHAAEILGDDHDLRLDRDVRRDVERIPPRWRPDRIRPQLPGPSRIARARSGGRRREVRAWLSLRLMNRTQRPPRLGDRIQHLPCTNSTAGKFQVIGHAAAIVVYLRTVVPGLVRGMVAPGGPRRSTAAPGRPAPALRDTRGTGGPSRSPADQTAVRLR
jgi:hypothetical protein